MRHLSAITAFGKGMLPALALAIAAITDPLRWPQALGLMEDFSWSINPWARQTIFATAAFVWMLGWYIKQHAAFEQSRPPMPNMPLHTAARYIARDSAWAASQPASLDSHWVEQVDRELVSKLLMGRLQAFGRFKPERDIAHNATDFIPSDFFKYAEWRCWDLVTPDPPTHVWRKDERGGGLYWNVMLDRDEVRRIWPKRSLWASFLKRSPVERLSAGVKGEGYEEIFQQQDMNYKRLIEGANPLSAFDEVFAEGSNATGRH